MPADADSLTSSTASYAVVGRPTTPGRISMITNTGSLAQNRRNSALIYTVSTKEEKRKKGRVRD